MSAIDPKNPALLADIVDLCQRYGWTGVGGEHCILTWLRNRLEILEDERITISPDPFRHGCVEYEIQEGPDAELRTELQAAAERVREQITDARQALDAIESELRDY